MQQHPRHHLVVARRRITDGALDVFAAVRPSVHDGGTCGLLPAWAPSRIAGRSTLARMQLHDPLYISRPTLPPFVDGVSQMLRRARCCSRPMRRLRLETVIITDASFRALHDDYTALFSTPKSERGCFVYNCEPDCGYTTVVSVETHRRSKRI